uniref:GIY-YIG domain-containing protein n=1 Tax=Strongyloides papillosus TaxID=174720 RepID=A0A0N5B772_STREA
MSRKIYFKVYFENDFEYDNFLKDMDFTELRHLFLENGTSKISIRVLKSCSSDGNSLYYGIYINLSNGPLHRAHFVIRISGTKEHEITNNGNLLRKKSLKKLGLFERNGLYLAMNKIVMNVLNGNLILECNNISIDTAKPISTQIMNHLYEQGYFNLENIFDVNRNIQKKFTLRWNGEFDVSGQGFQRKLSNKLNFNNIFVGKNNCEKYHMISFEECSKSDAEDKNSTFYEKISGYLHNDLF